MSTQRQIITIVVVIIIVLLGVWFVGRAVATPDGDDLLTQAETEEIARDWIEDESPTYTYDGRNLVLKSSRLTTDAYEFTYDFESTHAGYGDRTGQILAQVITPHTMVVTVEAREGEVIRAVTDGRYDELNEEMITTPLPSATSTPATTTSAITTSAV